jgi:hypothetical protein
MTGRRHNQTASGTGGKETAAREAIRLDLVPQDPDHLGIDLGFECGDPDIGRERRSADRHSTFLEYSLSTYSPSVLHCSLVNFSRSAFADVRVSSSRPGSPSYSSQRSRSSRVTR